MPRTHHTEAGAVIHTDRYSPIEAANFAIRFEPQINRWYQRNAAKKPRLVALKAVAHKLARAGYHLLRDGGTFDVHRAFA